MLTCPPQIARIDHLVVWRAADGASMSREVPWVFPAAPPLSSSCAPTSEPEPDAAQDLVAVEAGINAKAEVGLVIGRVAILGLGEYLAK